MPAPDDEQSTTGHDVAVVEAVTARAEAAAEAAERAAGQAGQAAGTASAAASTASDSAGVAADSVAQAAGATPEAASALEEHLEQLHARAEELMAAAAEDDLSAGHVRAAVAGVDEDNPFGRRGRPMAGNSSLRLGFALALGALLAYELLQAVLAVRQVLVLVLMSAFLAVGLDPAVTSLSRRMRRGLAAGLVMLAFLAVFAGFIAAVIPPLSHQVTQLVNHAPTYVRDLQQNSRVRDLDQRFGLLAKLQAQANKLPGVTVTAVGGVVGASKAVLGAIASIFTVLILTLYLLSNLPEIKRFFYRLVPRTRRARVSLLTDEILVRVGGYVLGNLAISVIAGLLALVVLFAAGVPYPVALALLIAITDLIPLVGATIGALIVVLVAFVGAGTTQGLVCIVYFVVYQQFENYVLQPRIMQRTVDVSPLATVLAALIGGSLLGVVGALIAIPTAAGIQLVLREVVVPRQDET